MKNTKTVLFNIAILFAISVFINCCRNNRRITRLPHPNTGNCDACTDASCTTVPLLCYNPSQPNPVSFIYRGSDGNNYADLTITNKSLSYPCNVEIDTDHPYVSLTGGATPAFILAPYGNATNSITLKILISKNWDGSKCNGTPCIFDSLKIRSRWDGFDTDDGFDEDHILFQWSKPVTISTFWIQADGGDNSYHGTIGQYSSPNVSSATTYFYNQIYAINNFNNFGVWIQVNNPPVSSILDAGCLTNNITFAASDRSNWAYIKANSGTSFGSAISTNFAPDGTKRDALVSTACLAMTPATAIVYSTEAPSGTQWISLQVLTQ